MLQIKNISKQYKTGELVQVALNNVSLNFRDNEFVSILGPSGSGKTTLLNIIGGLDHYDKGDLIINNISTKKYKDRDWDSYRNHTIGFVFQSYNLIPHQTVLSNVELALTISGVTRKERRKRALEVLDKVGLKEQAHKKPNQMSGGQMQRVAIARALVNDPKILLADEPTGALDSVTSVQVMELLKEVAKDRLVIMVTHNPDLAKNYSTRIVKLKDGEIIEDTNPYKMEEIEEPAKHKNLGKSSMSVFTAFLLSLNNLLTKKGRTFLTAFAESIGIIGIALILALSSGFQNYVDKIQEDTLTSYPLTVQQETADIGSALLSTMSSDEEEQQVKENTVQEQPNVRELFSSVGKNDLKSFKEYLEENKDEVDQMVSLTRYNYSVTPTVYTKNVDNELMAVNPNNLISTVMGNSSTLMTTSMSIFSELPESTEMVNEQYELLEGKFPEKYNEIVLVLPDENKISDLMLYSLGLRNQDELQDLLTKIMSGEDVEKLETPLEFTYDELKNIEFKLVDPSALYKYNEKYNVYEDMTEDEEFMNNVYNNSEKLNIVGIVKPKSQMTSMTGVLYTRDLTKYVIEKASNSEIVKKQLENENIDVFSGKSFNEDSKTSGIDFQDLVTIDEKAIEEAFNVNISTKDIQSMTEGYMKEISDAITTDTSSAKNLFLNNLSTIMKNILNNYIKENEVGGFAKINLSDVDNVVENGLNSNENSSILEDMEKQYVIPKDSFKSMYKEIISGFLKQYITMMGGITEEIPETDNVEENNNNEVQGNNENTTNSETITKDPSAILVEASVNTIVDTLVKQDGIIEGTEKIAQGMVEANMQKTILTKVGELTGKLMETMASSFNIDTNKFKNAFKFEMNEDEIRRLMESMTSAGTTKNANTNLLELGYQNLDEPTSIWFYFKDFDSKELFLNFLDEYNSSMESQDEEKVIKYSDLTGLLMSSVKTIIDSVSYVLIAFVSISLIVSSIMIGIITYISVLERKKEIGILRAIGASKKNISSIFNAETFIVGLFAGVIGIGVTLLLLIPINIIIHSINTDITAVLPFKGGAILVILSVILTLIGGLIPSKAAAKKDPVLALRSE